MATTGGRIMVRFIQAQKDEFDKIYKKKDELSAYDVFWEVQKHEDEYPLLYLFLFGSDDNCKNQDDFVKVWLDPSQIYMIEIEYYLIMFGAMYIALDENKEVQYVPKDAVPEGYKIKFTQLEIDSLQIRPEFKDRVKLDSFKVKIEVND